VQCRVARTGALCKTAVCNETMQPTRLGARLQPPLIAPPAAAPCAAHCARACLACGHTAKPACGCTDRSVLRPRGRTSDQAADRNEAVRRFAHLAPCQHDSRFLNT
jgi:hypothetical protein